MKEIIKLEESRARLLEQISKIRAMRKGSVTEQYLYVPQKGKAPERRGPYWLYTYKKKGKSVGRRLNPKEAERYIREVEASHLFQKLCDEYAEVTERLGELERQLEYDSPEKKLRKSRSSRTLK